MKLSYKGIGCENLCVERERKCALKFSMRESLCKKKKSTEVQRAKVFVLKENVQEEYALCLDRPDIYWQLLFTSKPMSSVW